jgi:hypothetical protein
LWINLVCLLDKSHSKLKIYKYLRVEKDVEKNAYKHVGCG